MPRSPLVATALIAAMASVGSARADEEPPDAQARAVAALPGATVRDLVSPPSLSIVGLGGGTRAISGRVAGIDRAMRELGARVIGQEVHVELPADVLFAFDRAEILPAAARALANVAALVRAHPGATVRVEGHTDSVGEAAYNLALSERRARAVVAWLERQEGLTGTRFEVKGFGEARPVAPNTEPDGGDDPGGRQKNRRVELVIASPR